MKDEIPLNEIRLFSRRPDEVGFETLISTIERLLEMALSRINEQEGGEDYRRGLLMTAVSGVAKKAPPDVPKPAGPIVEVTPIADIRADMAYPSRSKAQLKIAQPDPPPKRP